MTRKNASKKPAIPASSPEVAPPLEGIPKVYETRNLFLLEKVLQRELLLKNYASFSSDGKIRFGSLTLRRPAECGVYVCHNAISMIIKKILEMEACLLQDKKTTGKGFKAPSGFHAEGHLLPRLVFLKVWARLFKKNS